MRPKYVLYECDICGQYHRWTFRGDCRENAERFASVEAYNARRRPEEPEVRQVYGDAVAEMRDRVAADGRGER